MVGSGLDPVNEPVHVLNNATETQSIEKERICMHSDKKLCQQGQRQQSKQRGSAFIY